MAAKGRKDARMATAFDVWNRHGLKVEMKADGSDAATVLVTGPGFVDTWTWKCVPDEATPASLVCQRDGKRILEIGPKDEVPVPAKTITRP